jgi:hypothetical protein
MICLIKFVDVAVSAEFLVLELGFGVFMDVFLE